MKIETIEAPLVVRGSWTPVRIWLAIAVGLVAALALAAQAFLEWQAQPGHIIEPGPPGSLYSVQLVNGQIFYGTLLETRPGAVKLGDVYYTQPFTQANGQPGNRVVSRKKNDWHGPDWQLIPVDRILQMEAVGAQSQLAMLIAQDKSASH
jgi:hypothetical protein